MSKEGNLKLQEVYEPRVRYTNGLTIYFSDKQTIYATDGKVSIVLERWFEGNNFHKEHWKPMVEVLTKNKSITSVYKIWEIASRYDVCRRQSFSFPEIKKNTKQIKETR